MVRLSDGKKTLRIYVTVSAQYWRVTDRQTDILPRHSPRYAYVSKMLVSLQKLNRNNYKKIIYRKYYAK